MDRRDFMKTTGGLATLAMLKSLPASAAGRKGTLLVLVGDGGNSMDIHRSGTNRPAYQNAVNLYDRLVTFGSKALPDGSLMYDYEDIRPELAESWEIADDGLSMTFTLRADAVFWDGTPVTAEDVKWSFDRAVSVGGFATVQMAAGLLEKPAQFEAVDARTFRIHLDQPSKLTLPDLGVPVAIVINSKVAKAHVTEDDPWATEYLHRNPAGSGAYMLERWDPGQQTVFKRFDGWTSGPLPAIERVIVREVPEPATRRALLERGDADFALDLPSKDAKELAAAGKVKVVGVPIENSLASIGMNVTMPPFDNKLIRQAVAFAMPYEQLIDVACYGRGLPMFGGTAMAPETIAWPQPFPYATDLDKARALLAEAGLPDGFETTLSLNLGLAQWQEPAALLIQESLAKAGISVTIDKIPGANWRTMALVEKKLPLHFKDFGGWLNYPDYFFFWNYKDGHLFNSMNYRNKEIESLVDGTLHLSVKDPAYAPNIKRMLAIAFDEVPMVPLWQPFLDCAMQANIAGYEYWFHRQLDARKIDKA